MTIDKVIVNTPTTAERLAAARDRRNRLVPMATFLQQGVAAVRTAVITGVLGASGVRTLGHLYPALGEMETEVALTDREIAHLEEQRAAEIAMLPGTPNEKQRAAIRAFKDKQAKKGKGAKRVQ